MKLQHKLTLWFLAIALCVGGINAVWILRAQSTQTQFDRFSNQTTPTLIALGQMKAACMRLFKDLYRYALTAADDSADVSPAVAERLSLELVRLEDQYATSRQAYTEWFAVFSGAARDPQLAAHASVLESTAEEIDAQARIIFESVRQGEFQSAELAVRGELPLIEDRFLSVIDKMIAGEVSSMRQTKAAVTAQVGQTTLITLIGGVFLILLAIAAGVFIAGGLARPIIELSKDALYMGKDLRRRTHIKSGDEIGELAQAMNEMAETLERTTVSKQFVDRIITSMVDALFVTDSEGRVRSVNRAAEQLTGKSAKQWNGQPLVESFPEIGSLSNKELRMETVCAGADAKKVPVVFSAAPLMNANRTVDGFVCVALDITAQKSAEEAAKSAYTKLEQAQQQLVQSEKLSALGRFSAGIAHEVKNPLGIVLGGVEFLQDPDTNNPSDRAKGLDMIKEAAQRANRIVQDLLKFSKPSPLSKEAVAPQTLVEEALDLLKYSGKLKKVSLETEWDCAGCRVLVDRNQFQQVLLNLMVNAVDAMTPEDEVSPIERIKAMASGSKSGTAQKTGRPVRHSGLLVVRCLQVQGESPGCIIEIEDNGQGISPADMPQIFEPFFTTKRERKGTGLGLSISRTIIESLGGEITFESESGQGTVARIYLPIYRGTKNGGS